MNIKLSTEHNMICRDHKYISSTKLSSVIYNLLFEYRKTLTLIFNDIIHLHLIDYLSINIVSPNNELYILSSIPAIEFNVIAKEIWRFDKTYNPFLYKNEDLCWWEDAHRGSKYTELTKIKLSEHNLNLGFNIIQKRKDFNIIYSFATRSHNDLKEYYFEKKHEMLTIGNYTLNKMTPLLKNHGIILPNIDTSSFNNFKKAHLELVT